MCQGFYAPRGIPATSYSPEACWLDVLTPANETNSAPKIIAAITTFFMLSPPFKFTTPTDLKAVHSLQVALTLLTVI
mgnify:CR=1 FL=1